MWPKNIIGVNAAKIHIAVLPKSEKIMKSAGLPEKKRLSEDVAYCRKERICIKALNPNGP